VCVIFILKTIFYKITPHVKCAQYLWGPWPGSRPAALERSHVLPSWKQERGKDVLNIITFYLSFRILLMYILICILMFSITLK
jgi:hypothetical protein